MRFAKLFLPLFVVLLSAFTTAHAKEQLMVRDLEAQRVDKVTTKALSDIIKSTLGEYYSVQSMDALAALSSVVEEKLKAGCDDTKCLIEVAGAMDIGLVATGSISKLGSLYTLNMQLISTRGTNLGVIQRASEECECSEQQLVDLSKRVALKLIDKKPQPAAQPSATSPSASQLGMTFQEITPNLARAWGLTQESGIIIMSIEPNSSVEAADLKKGDIIKEINRRPVTTAAEFYEALGQSKGTNILLLIKRGRASLWVVVKPKK